jgi:2-polyprenyl-6-hydroxyphenyl methylase/3-demethylubiquinone-9 3-methyltransferase
MEGYYKEKLSAKRLKRCYDIASPRVQQYFECELNHVLSKINPGDRVLDLGCGYGRIMPELARKAGMVVGIDNSHAGLVMAREILYGIPNCLLAEMNAVQQGFAENTFDVTVCIQNGISAFHVDQKELIKESIRVTRPGGIVLFSSYSDKFWQYRLEWFYRQAGEGLLGEIDPEKTGNGVIVCKDGFTATTVGPSGFNELTDNLHVKVCVVEVDESSVFCEIEK